MKMKLCPFCGGIPEYFNGWLGDKKENGREPSMCCEDCGIWFAKGVYGFGISDKYAKEDTIKAWNRRISESEDDSTYTTCVCGHRQVDHNGDWGNLGCNFAFCGCKVFTPQKCYDSSGCPQHTVTFESKGKCIHCGKQVSSDSTGGRRDNRFEG